MKTCTIDSFSDPYGLVLISACISSILFFQALSEASLFGSPHVLGKSPICCVCPKARFRLLFLTCLIWPHPQHWTQGWDLKVSSQLVGKFQVWNHSVHCLSPNLDLCFSVEKLLFLFLTKCLSLRLNLHWLCLK